jgi:hypothetical protein
VPFFVLFFYGVFVRFSIRGVQKHHKKFSRKVHVKSFWPKKLRVEKKLFSCRLFPSTSDFFIAFLAVSLQVEPKNTTEIFSKIRPENLKKSQEEVGR